MLNSIMRGGREYREGKYVYIVCVRNDRAQFILFFYCFSAVLINKIT